MGRSTSGQTQSCESEMPHGGEFLKVMLEDDFFQLTPFFCHQSLIWRCLNVYTRIPRMQCAADEEVAAV